MRIVFLAILLVVISNCRRLDPAETRSDRQSERQVTEQFYLLKLELNPLLRPLSSGMHGDLGCLRTAIERQSSGLVVVKGDVTRKVRAKRNGKTVLLTKVDPTVTSQLTSNLTPISGSYNQFTLPLYIKQLQTAQAGLGEEIAYQFVRDDTSKKILLRIDEITDDFNQYKLSAVIDGDSRRFEFMQLKFSASQQMKEMVRKMPKFLIDEPAGVTVKLELKENCRVDSKDGELWQGLTTDPL